MSTNFKAQGTTVGPRPVHELLLNGFNLSLSAETFSARRIALPDNKSLKDLRAQHPGLVYLLGSSQNLSENLRLELLQKLSR